jgi:hypothetical protein
VVWIVALMAGWFSAFVLLLALTTMASRSDRPTADHLVARRGRPHLWLPPQADRDRGHVS